MHMFIQHIYGNVAEMHAGRSLQPGTVEIERFGNFFRMTSGCTLFQHQVCESGGGMHRLFVVSAFDHPVDAANLLFAHREGIYGYPVGEFSNGRSGKVKRSEVLYRRRRNAV